MVNYGSIAGGVNLLSGGSVTNAKTGSIAGGTEVRIGGGTGTVVNQGDISGSAVAGILLLSGGSVRNTASASITGFYRGVEIDGGGTVLNYGSITSTARSSEAFDLPGGGMVINEAGGSLTGSFTVAIGDGSAAATLVNRGNISGRYIGVTLSQRYGADQSATNTASGKITGPVGVGMSDGGNLTNAGSIVGTDGTAVSCYGTAGSNLVVLDPGFEFTGLVIGNTSASASNTLELASATSVGTVTGIGTQFLHFNSLVFDPGAKWTAAGIVRGFSETITGFAAGDTIDITGGGIVPTTVSGPGKLQLDEGVFLDTVAQISGSGGVAGVGSVVVNAGAVLELMGGGALPTNISGGGTLELLGKTPYTFANGETLGIAHCVAPQPWPIFDQHTYRAMHFMKTGEPKEIPDKKSDIYTAYREDYIPFVKRLNAAPRKIDKALYSFGQFLRVRLRLQFVAVMFWLTAA